jgi:hypothetical protein
MDRGVLEELCVRVATNMYKMVASQEHFYNTTHHISIEMSPFRELYGYDAPYFVDFVFGESQVPKSKDWLQEIQDFLRVPKENIRPLRINKRCMHIDTGYNTTLSLGNILSFSDCNRTNNRR